MWLRRLGESKPIYYRCVHHIFALFKSQDHLTKFFDCLNKYHTSMKFFSEQERNGKLSFFRCGSVPWKKQMLLSMENLLLVLFIHILTAFYHPHSELPPIIL